MMNYNDHLYFWPVPVTGEQITIYSQSMPTDAQLQVEGTGDPILSRHWDLCLRYGALSIITSDPKWRSQFDAEFRQEAQNHIQENRGAPIQVDHSINRLGF
jgi:hypothetical protein